MVTQPISKTEPEQIGDIFKKKPPEPAKKPPAFQWQDLALRIIDELHIPSFKRNSVFKACKEHDKYFIEKCVADTKELVKGDEKWKYFFKLVAEKPKNKQ
ncbi:hypothetical protein KKB10_04440 [Patescibacteria group bacterium]|nr:hypothetical protein [Patescibacteria group bacterium]MBU1951521.1 hypothetical protein [Patescibacteria group bacterium]